MEFVNVLLREGGSHRWVYINVLWKVLSEDFQGPDRRSHAGDMPDNPLAGVHDLETFKISWVITHSSPIYLTSLFMPRVAKLLGILSHISKFDIFREPQLNTHVKGMQKSYLFCCRNYISWKHINKSTKYVYWIWILKSKLIYFTSLDSSVGLESSRLREITRSFR